ncbi:MAG: hypothetical protein JOS17DRAFT_228836 [Linnemannia elongata]|nr:MAG: hypothetical protein JOS17DRAFT_228836 [Linnemannia elongata]
MVLPAAGMCVYMCPMLVKYLGQGTVLPFLPSFFSRSANLILSHIHSHIYHISTENFLFFFGLCLPFAFAPLSLSSLSSLFRSSFPFPFFSSPSPPTTITTLPLSSLHSSLISDSSSSPPPLPS